MDMTATDWNRQDRDLLVELRTEMKGIRSDIQNLSDGNNARLTLLEQGKLDRTEANRLQSESLSVHVDHESRLRLLEKRGWFYAGGASATGAVAAFLAHILLK